MLILLRYFCVDLRYVIRCRKCAPSQASWRIRTSGFADSRGAPKKAVRYKKLQATIIMLTRRQQGNVLVSCSRRYTYPAKWGHSRRYNCPNISITQAISLNGPRKPVHAFDTDLIIGDLSKNNYQFDSRARFRSCLV